jgi:predicted RNA-binding Zn ribbon-like protein
MTMQNKTGARLRAADRLTDGGSHALNFINTWKRNHRGRAMDLLQNYSDVLSWAHKTNLLDWDRYLLLDEQRHNDAIANAMCYREAVGLRLCLDELFNDLIAGRQVYPHTLSRFNDYAQSIRPHLTYQHGVTGLRLYWDNIAEEISLPLWLIISEACNLIDSGRYRDIKKCPSCSCLFLDVSRRHNRKWCSAQTCGSIKKSRNYYHLKTA